MIYVTNRPNIDVRLAAIKLLFAHLFLILLTG